MTRDQGDAEAVALKCLDWLAGNEDLWPVFIGSTGANEADLKKRITDPDLYGAVLDFILMDDLWVQACCTAKSLPTDAPMRARQSLPGGAMVSWT